MASILKNRIFSPFCDKKIKKRIDDWKCEYNIKGDIIPMIRYSTAFSKRGKGNTVGPSSANQLGRRGVAFKDCRILPRNEDNLKL